MEPLSRAWRTDLALLQLSGSVVEQRPSYVVVRTPANPTFRWGNFLLLPRAPADDDVPALLDAFARELPGHEHRAFGIDDPHGSRSDLDGLARAGFDVDVSVVLTSAEVQPPPHPNTAVEVRRLTGDDDWAQRVALDLAVNESEPAERYEPFARRRAASQRRSVEAGHGAWFGAFDEGRLVSALGVFRAGEGLARYQEVKTRPDARGRGLAGTLVHAAGDYACTELGARTVVIVADPEYAAIRLYRAVGFAETEVQLRAERRAS